MSVKGARSTVALVSGEAGQSWSQRDDLRRLIGGFAVAVAVVAAVADPGSTGEVVLGAVAAGALVLWAVLPAVPLVPVSIAVVVPVVLAQRSGGLEPLMFEASLLAFVVGRWSASIVSAAALGLLAAACPIAVSAAQDRPQCRRGRKPDPKPTGSTGGEIARRLGGPLGRGQRLARVRQPCDSGFRQRHTARGALEQLDPQQRLEPFYRELVNGRRFVDWVTRLIGGKPVDDVRCRNCRGG
jgi:hypothetical protein